VNEGDLPQWGLLRQKKKIAACKTSVSRLLPFFGSIQIKNHTRPVSDKENGPIKATNNVFLYMDSLLKILYFGQFVFYLAK
jgi:hypothetical protein